MSCIAYFYFSGQKNTYINNLLVYIHNFIVVVYDFLHMCAQFEHNTP